LIPEHLPTSPPDLPWIFLCIFCFFFWMNEEAFLLGPFSPPEGRLCLSQFSFAFNFFSDWFDLIRPPSLQWLSFFSAFSLDLEHGFCRADPPLLCPVFLSWSPTRSPFFFPSFFLIQSSFLTGLNSKWFFFSAFSRRSDGYPLNLLLLWVYKESFLFHLRAEKSLFFYNFCAPFSKAFLDPIPQGEG